MSHKCNLVAGLAAAAFWLTPALAGPIARSTPVPLTLINGWTNAPFSTRAAAAEIQGNIVHLEGAIATTGTNTSPFVLPPAFRPSYNIYVPVDMCNATNGRLLIAPSGVVTVQAESDFANAQCFTSLESVVYSPVDGGVPVSPLNGWTGMPFGTGVELVNNDKGIIRFRGAVSGGTAAELFVLPAKFRPTVVVYTKVDLCNGTNGRLIIQPSGEVDVQAEGDFSNAQCFTSLDGASFAIKPMKPLTLQDGWTISQYHTAAPGARTIAGVTYFQGAMSTTGTNAQPFTLPKKFRPLADVYLPVDMCSATNGRLHIQPSGAVTVQAESDFSNAQCFTSLDGVSFLP